MNRSTSPRSTPAKSVATGSFLSGLLHDLKLDVEGLEIVSDNARTKRIRRPLPHDTPQHQKAKCRWSNIVDDSIKSPSSSSSSSSRRQHLPQQQHSRSSSGSSRKQSSPSQDHSMRWDDVVVDKQNVSSPSINTRLRDLVRGHTLDCKLPDLAPSSPSTSSRNGNERGLQPPTRQTSLESEKGREMRKEDDDEASVNLEKEQERLKEKRADKPLSVPQRGEFVNKQPRRSNSISDSLVIGAMSKVQHTWNQRYSPKRHKRPGITKAHSMSYIHSARTEKDNTTALLNLVKRVDHIMLEDTLPSASIPVQRSSSIDSASMADTTPSPPIRRTSLEKSRKKKKKMRGTKKQQQQQPRALLQRAASTSKLLSSKVKAIDPLMYNDSTHITREESDGNPQPHLLRSAEVRTPTPPRQGQRNGSRSSSSSSSSSSSEPMNLSPRAKATASALEQALDIAIAPGRTTTPASDNDDDNDDGGSSCSLSVCSDIYSDAED